jgi:hypothetical protein
MFIEYQVNFGSIGDGILSVVFQVASAATVRMQEKIQIERLSFAEANVFASGSSESIHKSLRWGRQRQGAALAR